MTFAAAHTVSWLAALLRTRRGRFVAVALLVAAVPFFAWARRRPLAARDWSVDHAVPAAATLGARRVMIRNVRNFSYAANGTPIPAYYDAAYDLDSVQSVWFVLTTFSRRWRAPAHTFVSFGFTGGRYLAVSVEARKERDEPYGIWAGMVRNFELIYVIGDERDLIGRRAFVEGDATYLYPVRAPREKVRALLVSMLERANRVAARPEFYHSLLNSCASNLIDHVNAVTPGRIPGGLANLLPGYADEVALRLGLIQSSGDVERARREFLVVARAPAGVTSEAFSALIRER